MPVIVKHNEYRCKLCRSDRVAEINALLERRSRRERDEHGEPINGDYVRKVLLEWGIPNPTIDNISSHWKKHCEVVSDAQAAAEAEKVGEALQLLQDRLLNRDMGPDTLTDDLIEIAQASLREQIAQGVIPKVTIDQALKAVDTKTRRKQNEKVMELLDLQADALTQSLGFHQPAALEAGEVEVVEDE